LLLFEKLAVLILTLLKMFTDAQTFLGLTAMYLIMAVTIFMMLFQESYENYQSMLYAFRTLFDAMLGSYNHISTSDD
jgi:hypothetical protein